MYLVSKNHIGSSTRNKWVYINRMLGNMRWWLSINISTATTIMMVNWVNTQCHTWLGNMKTWHVWLECKNCTIYQTIRKNRRIKNTTLGVWWWISDASASERGNVLNHDRRLDVRSFFRVWIVNIRGIIIIKQETGGIFRRFGIRNKAKKGD